MSGNKIIVYYQWGLLLNLKLKKYHPILFRLNPRPSEDVGEQTHCRFKSAGHHTEGFDSLDGAINEMKTTTHPFTGFIDVWDGEEVPARIGYLPIEVINNDYISGDFYQRLNNFFASTGETQ